MKVLVLIKCYLKYVFVIPVKKHIDSFKSEFSYMRGYCDGCKNWTIDLFPWYTDSEVGAKKICDRCAKRRGEA